MVARVMISGVWRPIDEARALLNHPGHADQKSHGRGGGGESAVGGDLIKGGGRDVAVDALAQADSHGASASGRGPRGDERLRAIAERQGFDGPPRVVSRQEMDDLVASGSPEMFRGVADHVTRQGTNAGSELAEQFRSGDLYYGSGIYGNGTYASTSRSGPGGAEEWARTGYLAVAATGSPGAVMRMTLHPSAKVIDYKNIQAQHRRYLKSVPKDSPEARAFGDLGRFATARGYDAIRAPGGKFGGGPGSYQYNILNRTALAVEQA